MKKRSAGTVDIIDEFAEGGTKVAYEPMNPLSTSTFPRFMSDIALHNRSETGLHQMVSTSNEDEDQTNDEDSPDTTSGETDKSNEKTTEESSEKEVKPVMDEEKSSEEMAPLVFIVEDTVELAEIIQATLERMNLRTAHETHGERALDKLPELSPDVILLDISLPDMTGWKILDAVKERHEKGVITKMPAVVVITAYGDPANRLVGKLQKVYSYLVKPFTSSEVEKIVTNALQSATS